MKWLRISLFVLICSVALSGAKASALDTVPFDPPPELPDSPVLIAAYSLTAAKPGYMELFNSSSQPVNLAGWKVEYVTKNTAPVVLATLDGWIAPSNYVIVADEVAVDGADFIFQLSEGMFVPKNFRLVAPGTFSPHEVAVSSDGRYQRRVSASTGNYLSTFDSVTTPVLYSGGFYTFPDATSLQFSEIVAHPRTCSPLDTALDCVDYVKLYNPSSLPIDLSAFRLRVGYKGQSSSSSNTFTLSGVVEPGHFVTITSDDAGRPISVTNSGGFVWLEDTYGIVRYDTTVQAYEDASASSKKGQAWAYDASDDTWKWTTQPTPGDTASVFPPPVIKPTTIKTKTYAPCRPSQYRSKETNRCRNLASLATASLKPCLAGQSRNPATNRCRNVATAATSKLKPCAPGQERNPATNRCKRASSAIPESAFAVEPLADTDKVFAGWWALGGVGILAAGYGAWEWRHEALSGIRKIGTFFTSSK